MQCLWLRLLWNYRSYINTNMLVVASRRLLTILHLTFDWCFGFDLLHSRKCRPLLHIYHIYVLLTVAYAENFQGWVHSVAYGGHFFDVHCLWRHNMTSYSCFQTNVLAKFVGIIRIFVYTSGLQRGRNCPHGAISCVVGAILWFTRFGGRFRFPGGDFCRLKHTQMLNWFQKIYICYFGIKAFDARSTPWFVTKVIKHISDWSRTGAWREGEGWRNSPDAKLLWGRRTTAGLRRKVPKISQVLSSMQWIYFRKSSGSNTGAPNLLLAPVAIWPRYAPGHASIKLL